MINKINKIITIIIYLFVLTSIYCEDTFLLQFIPKDNNIITHEYYYTSFNQITKICNWNIYRLTKERSINNTSPRISASFCVDPLIINCPSSIEYIKQKIDKGHLIPADDCRFDIIALKEAFYMSNISPQYIEFNRGIWKKLENLIRKWVEKDNRNIIIITGTIVDYNNIHTIGKSKIYIPSAFFKIIYDYERYEAISFLIPHNKVFIRTDLNYFKKTIKEIEDITKLKFNFKSSIKNKIGSFNL